MADKDLVQFAQKRGGTAMGDQIRWVKGRFNCAKKNNNEGQGGRYA